MAKGFFISKTVGILCAVLGVAAVSTIIALSVVYSQEKSKNAESATDPSTSVTPPTTATTTPDPKLPWNQYRLPLTLIPQSYSVSLRPFLTPNNQNLYVFHGNSTVVFECKEPTNVVIIHSKKLNYTTDPVLRGVGGAQAPEISHWNLVEFTEYLVLHLKDQLQKGKLYEMDTRFVGELADDLAGFYRSEYDDNGITKVVATTQMQAADARKSFPCFDEPAMKAYFNITLIHPSNLKALSNMQPKGPSTPLPGAPDWSVTEFERTPKMSTYLLAYIVCEFDAEESQSPENKILIRIWARPSAIKAGHGKYALNVTGPILDFFTKHYNTSYPLDKSDQIGLPDFNAGAMENWGLVTYRENSLLFDPASSSIGNKERVVTVIAHELAHQWFGNLVTVAWWNDLWLNEGFASYVEYLGADYAEPSWNLKDLMVLNELYRVMAVDALASSHPLSTPADEVKTPAQISELFDSISYSKGASVLRMLSSFLTEDLFKKGLASYLHAFKYNNTVYQDLWDHLQKAVDENGYNLPNTVKNIMDRWILQMGFPVVTVNTSTGNITQEHFLLDPESTVNRPSQFNYLWIVPVTFMKNGVVQQYWLEGVQSAQNNDFKSTNEWVLVNINVTGYFRVNYDEDNWRRLQSQLQSNLSLIPVINRAQIIHDAFTLSSAGMVSVTLALDNTLFLLNDTEYMPWQAAIDSLSYFKLMFDRDQEVYGPMKNYLEKQVTPLFRHFETITEKWTKRPATLMDQYNEVNAISTACSNGFPDCHTLVTDLYKRWMENPTDNTIIHPNLRSVVYCNAIALGGSREWEFAWEQFRNATVVNEADKLRAALACTTNTDTLLRYLEYSLDPKYIRKQDATSTISSVASNVHGQALAWTFVKYNWKKLFENYGGGSFSFSNLIQAVTRRFNTQYDLDQLEQFKKDNMDTGFGSGTRALEQALERTKANIKWVEANKDIIRDWFKSKGGP